MSKQDVSWMVVAILMIHQAIEAKENVKIEAATQTLQL
jgi:hypothetical protein